MDEHPDGALAAPHDLGDLAHVHAGDDPQQDRVGLVGGQATHQRQGPIQVVVGLQCIVAPWLVGWAGRHLLGPSPAPAMNGSR